MSEQNILEEIRQLKILVIKGLKNKDMLTTKEASEYVGCTPYTIRDLARKKVITHYKDPAGRLIRFQKKDLDEWMRHKKVCSNEELEQEALAYTYRKRTI